MKDEREFIKVHVLLLSHPKVIGLSDKSFRALIELWCHCSMYRTDGRVSEPMWRSIAAGCRTQLLTVGLAHELGDGAVRMHDYEKHQQTAAEIEARAEERATAGARGNHRRWHEGRGVVDEQCPLCVKDPKTRRILRAIPEFDPILNGLHGSQTDRNSDPKPIATAIATATPTESLPTIEGSSTDDRSGRRSESLFIAEVEVDKEELKTKNKNLAAIEKSRRGTDELWEALLEVLKIDCGDITAMQRGALNRVVKELRAVGATPAQVHTRAQRYREAFPSAAFTGTALAKHWGALAGPPRAVADLDAKLGSTNFGGGW